MPDEGRIVDESEMRKIGKQIRLPWTKAAEIAAKSVKIRFGRSVVTTLSIILAIAFLMSILTSTTLVASLKTRPVREVVRKRAEAQKVIHGEDVALEFPGGQTLEANRERIADMEKQLKAGTLATLEKALLKEQLEEAKAEKEVLQAMGAGSGKLEEAKARWRLAKSRADRLAAETEWQLLWRKLQAEGYTDVKAEFTEAPEETSFLRTLATQMDPRDRWLAALAALVCFVGILNAMLMSVHERFREIGTMKCLGALESFIVKLYFLESSFIGMVGTLIGIGIGFLLSLGRAMAAFGFGTVLRYFDFRGACLSALGTLLIGSLLSVAAAYFPARAAARMDPVEAMRVEE